MADLIEVTKKCDRCGGDGIFPNMEKDPITGEMFPPENPVACTECSGTGYQTVGYLPASFQEQIDDIQSTINDILVKCNDIFEKLNE